LGPDELAVGDRVTWDHWSFTIQFGISFNPKADRGFGGAPSDEQLVQIGIVQNVLFLMNNFEYDNQQNIGFQMLHAAVDIRQDAFTRVFTGEPFFGVQRPNERPYSVIWFTSQGYGELLNPNDPSGVSTNNKPDSFFAVDEPSSVVVRELNGGLIRRIEDVITFQAWLVALSGGQMNVLAHVPPFTLVFWLDRTSGRGDYFHSPKFRFGIYGENGIFNPQRGVNRDHQHTGLGGATGRVSPNVQPGLGNGGRVPLTSGRRAADILNGFLKARGLLPRAAA
jgi:hypothetical protein